jgi:hypothetical protein
MNTLTYLPALPTHKSSITTYNHESRYGVLVKLIKARAAPGRDVLDAMLDEALMEAIIEGQDWSKGTKKNYWNTLLTVAKGQPARPRIEEVMAAYREKMADISGELAEDSWSQEMTDKQQAAWMDYGSIQAFGKAFMERTDMTLEDRILIGLFTQLPPVRLDYTDLEVRSVAVAPTAMTPNHVYVHPTEDAGAYVYVGTHKTSTTRGPIKYDLTPGLCSLFREYRTKYPAFLCLAVSPGALGKRLNKIFLRYSPEKKPVTVNIIRHAKATADCETMNLPMLRNFVADAKNMKHDVMTHILYAKKTT